MAAGAQQFCTPFNTWSTELATPIGGASRDITLAGQAINRAIMYLNIWNWPHERVMDDTVTLATGVDNYTMNENYKAYMKAIVLDVAGTTETSQKYTWVNPAEFESIRHAGYGDIYTTRNIALDSKLFLLPAPTASINGRKLRVYAYKRTPTLTGSNKLLADPEFEMVVNELAHYYLMRWSYPEQPTYIAEARRGFDSAFAGYCSTIGTEYDPDNAPVLSE